MSSEPACICENIIYRTPTCRGSVNAFANATPIDDPAKGPRCIRLRCQLRWENAYDNKFKEVGAMKFPGGFNIQQMMKQAQVMQEKMAKEMDELRTEASAGGGVVTVEMKGNHEIVSLKIDPEAVKEGDVEMLQDMILAAINEANRKVDEAMKGKLGGMLPPGLGGMLG
jgi:DNA-binding YbaB/EbfC family protein